MAGRPGVPRILPGAPRAPAPAFNPDETDSYTDFAASGRTAQRLLVPVPAGCGRRLALPAGRPRPGGERLIEPLRAQRRRTWATSSSSLPRRVSRTRGSAAAAGPACAARLTANNPSGSPSPLDVRGAVPWRYPVGSAAGQPEGEGSGASVQGEGDVDRLVIRSRRAERLVVWGCLVGGCRPGLSVAIMSARGTAAS